MHDVADVPLVDPHAEGAGRHHHQPAAPVHEPLLLGLAVGLAHPAVIAGARNPRPEQRGVDLIDGLGRSAVDDARPLEPAQDVPGPREFLVSRRVVRDEPQVRPVRRRQDLGRVLQLQSSRDVRAHARRGRGGEGEDLRNLQGTALGPQPQVGGPEVVAPLRDAVRLVDAEQLRPAPAHRRAGVIRLERLGGRQDDERAPLLDPGQGFPARLRPDRAVEAHHRYVPGLEPLLLVAHERQQRGDDERRPVTQEGGHLVDQRLAVSGRKDHQGVPTRQHRLDRLLLLGAEPGDAEVPARRPPRRGEGGLGLPALPSGARWLRVWDHPSFSGVRRQR
jgi:hypothetical protein